MHFRLFFFSHHVLAVKIVHFCRPEKLTRGFEERLILPKKLNLAMGLEKFKESSTEISRNYDRHRFSNEKM